MVVSCRRLLFGVMWVGRYISSSNERGWSQRGEIPKDINPHFHTNNNSRNFPCIMVQHVTLFLSNKDTSLKYHLSFTFLSRGLPLRSLRELTALAAT